MSKQSVSAQAQVSRSLAALLAGWLLSAPAWGAEAPVLRFASEEWPPFFSTSMPDNGLTGALLQAVVGRMGYVKQVDFYPWKRAMALGMRDPRYVGVVAVFRTPERERLCHLSSAVGSRHTVLAFLKKNPLPATSLPQLHGIRIGTVAGYSNGEQFDALVRSGQLEVEEGVSDEVNLRKLLAGRFPAIVIEKRLMRYLLLNKQNSPVELDSIGTADKLFQDRTVHVCFQRTPTGQKLQLAFDKAARDVDLVKVERLYWQRINDAVPTPPPN